MRIGIGLTNDLMSVTLSQLCVSKQSRYLMCQSSEPLKYLRNCEPGEVSWQPKKETVPDLWRFPLVSGSRVFKADGRLMMADEREAISLVDSSNWAKRER